MKTIKVEFLKDHTFILPKENGKKARRISISVIQQSRIGEKKKAGGPPAKFAIPNDWHDDWVLKGIIKSSRKKKK